MEKKEEKIFRDIVKILEQDVPQEALAEGNPTPEQEAIALIKQELDKAREEGELRILEGATVQAKGLRIRSVYRNGYKYTLDIKKEKVSKLNKEE